MKRHASGFSMATPTVIAGYLALFALMGFLFVFVNLLLGRFLRPNAPNEEKQEIYECGEPVIGSSFVQFDLRFYVVALLFIIFDVEVAFFFPWATVFGKSTQLLDENVAVVESTTEGGQAGAQLSPVARARLQELGVEQPTLPTLSDEQARQLGVTGDATARADAALRSTAGKIAWTSFADIAVFFGVLLVGFAYEWRTGALDWVRAVESPSQSTIEKRSAGKMSSQESVLSA